MFERKTMALIPIVMATLGFGPFSTARAQQEDSNVDSEKKPIILIVRHDEAVQSPISSKVAISAINKSSREMIVDGAKKIVQRGVVVVYHNTAGIIHETDAYPAADESDVATPPQMSESEVRFVPAPFSIRTQHQDPTRRAWSVHDNAAWSYHPPSFKYTPKRYQGYNTRRDWKSSKQDRVGYAAKRNWSYHRR